MHPDKECSTALQHENSGFSPGANCRHKRFFWNKSSIDQLNALLKAGKPEVA